MRRTRGVRINLLATPSDRKKKSAYVTLRMDKEEMLHNQWIQFTLPYISNTVVKTVTSFLGQAKVFVTTQGNEKENYVRTITTQQRSAILEDFSWNGVFFRVCTCVQ